MIGYLAQLLADRRRLRRMMRGAWPKRVRPGAYWRPGAVTGLYSVSPLRRWRG